MGKKRRDETMNLRDKFTTNYSHLNNLTLPTSTRGSRGKKEKKKKHHTGRIRSLSFFCFIKKSILKLKCDRCSILTMIYWMLMLKRGFIYSHILLIASAVYVPGQVPGANDPPVTDSPKTGWKNIFLVLTDKDPVLLTTNIYIYK